MEIMSELTWRIEKRKLSDLKFWDKNPRKISKEQLEKLKQRITERGFHDVLKIDSENVVLSGNQRLKVLRELGFDEVDCKIPERELTNDEKDKIGLESNFSDGENDLDLLSQNFDADLLFDVGFTDEQLGLDVDSKSTTNTYDEGENGSLIMRFGAPPFSILDSRLGYWIEKKNNWIDLGINSGKGRDEGLLAENNLMSNIGEGTSIFDPFLCEILYKWFCVEN